MTALVFCFVFVFALVLNAANGETGHLRIVGGEPVLITQYPYQAELRISDMHNCGGSIISQEYILTAAHCVNRFDPDIIKVRVGNSFSNKTEGGQLVNVTNIYVHPQFDDTIFDYDVAVLKVSQKIVIDGVNTKIVELSSSGSSLAPGQTVKVSGWGAMKENGPLSDILRAVTVPVMSPETCRSMFATIPVTYTDRMFCAGFPEGGKDSCNGDSGGPVVHSETLVQYGIVSWGHGCARPNLPGAYTLIPAVRDWIKQVTGL